MTRNRAKPKLNRHINELGAFGPYNPKQIAAFNRAHDAKYGFDLAKSYYTRPVEIPVMRGRPDLRKCRTREERDKAAWDAHFRALEPL
jgi:hypothetical protein